MKRWELEEMGRFSKKFFGKVGDEGSFASLDG